MSNLTSMYLNSLLIFKNGFKSRADYSGARMVLNNELSQLATVLEPHPFGMKNICITLLIEVFKAQVPPTQFLLTSASIWLMNTFLHRTFCFLASLCSPEPFTSQHILLPGIICSSTQFAPCNTLLPNSLCFSKHLRDGTFYSSAHFTPQHKNFATWNS